MVIAEIMGSSAANRIVILLFLVRHFCWRLLSIHIYIYNIYLYIVTMVVFFFVIIYIWYIYIYNVYLCICIDGFIDHD